MRAETSATVEDEIRTEYDFSKGVRGRHAHQTMEGDHVVVLAPDVAELFPDAESVNTTLRAVAAAARRLVDVEGR